MLTALCELASSPRRSKHTEVLFIGLIDEECKQLGSRVVATSGLTADLAIVGEPTLLKLVTAHKGDLWLSLRTAGRAAHGATPRLGRNAVHRMARVVEALETDYAAQLGQRRHHLLGSPTINVGAIRGGTQANIVPDECTIEIDRRTLPGETVASVRREIRSVLKEHRLTAKIGDVKGVACPALETNWKRPWVGQFMEQLGQTRPMGVHYFCDAAVLASGGIPSVVFGPGNIAQAHTAEEWIETQSLNAATRLLRRFMESLP
jgi:acetylornithine deacetylase/succinyl-diaminopimelate desuccinylase-like protein